MSTASAVLLALAAPFGLALAEVVRRIIQQRRITRSLPLCGARRPWAPHYRCHRSMHARGAHRAHGYHWFPWETSSS